MFVLDLENPTDPANYIDREFSAGTPFNWQDEASGQLMQAVMAYLRQEPTPEQLQLVIKYLQYYIHAPVWLDGAVIGPIDPEIVAEIVALRELSLKMTNLAEVNQYIYRALRVAIDPL